MEEMFDISEYKRIAIMGGTFDPIHYGHLVTAEAVAYEYNIDKVIFIPSGNPPHKDREISGREHRYLMTQLATLNNFDFLVSRLEIERIGKTYTIDTIKELRKNYAPNAEIYFITGADAIHEILTWKDAEELLQLCSFVAATRPGYDAAALRDIIDDIKIQYQSRIHFLATPSLDISSSDVRERVALDKPIRYMVPHEVEYYIRKFGLYK